MEIISRAEAKALGQKTYFTGDVCKNGHTAYRYVQSGTCSACINGDHRHIGDPNFAARKAAKEQLIQVRVRMYDSDRESVAAGAWALVVMRYPVLTQGDVDPRLLPKDKTAGTGLYAFNCHPDDIAAVRQLGADSISRRTINPEARRAEIVRNLAASGGNL